MKKQGFIEGILSDAARNSIVDRCRDENGKINTNQAIAIAHARGYTSFEDRVRIINYANVMNQKNDK